MKTSEVAKELGVSPKTVLKWMKQYDIKCEKNELGHFEFKNEHLELLREKRGGKQPAEIKREATVRIQVQGDETEKRSDLQKQMDQIVMRLMENERRTEEKAGEVVTFQILEHRSEIEELKKKVQQLEARVKELEEQHQNGSLPVGQEKPSPRWKAFLTSIF